MFGRTRAFFPVNELNFCCLMRRKPCRKNKTARQPTQEARVIQAPAASRPLRIDQSPATKPAENAFVEDFSSTPQQAHWNCDRKRRKRKSMLSRSCRKCKIQPMLRTDRIKGRRSCRHMVMEIIKEQAPDVILMAPVRGPWFNMWNTQKDQQKASEKPTRHIPMVELVASIARYQFNRWTFSVRRRVPLTGSSM